MSGFGKQVTDGLSWSLTKNISGVFSYLQTGTPGALPIGQQPDPEDKSEYKKTFSYNFLTTKDDVHTASEYDGSEKFYKQFLYESDDIWNKYPRSASGKKSGSFSGEMRAVVQILAGYNREIFYDYHSYLTHGIFVEPTTGERYVIEISANGLFYWKLKARYGGEKSLRRFYHLSEDASLPIPYVPSAIDKKPESAVAINIDGIDFQELLTKQHLSLEIGWAFSYSGHEAQTVLLETVPHIPVGMTNPGDYYKAHRYKFSFRSFVNDAGIVTISATLSDVETEWFWYEWLQNHIRVPVFTKCGPAQKRITTISIDTPVAPIDETYEFPFYVFYTKQDVECVFRYHRGKPEHTNRTDKPYPSTGLNGFDIRLEKSYNGDYYVGRDDTEWDVRLTCSNPDFYFGEQRRKLKWTYSTFIRQHELGRYPYVLAVSTESSPPFLSVDNVIVAKDTKTNGSNWEDYLFSFIIPFFEREGFYLYQRTYDWPEGSLKIRSAMVAGTNIHSPSISAYWGVALGGHSYGGHAIPPCIYKLASRVQAYTCQFAGDSAPPSAPTGGYVLIDQSVGENLNHYEPNSTILESCSQYGQEYLGDTILYYKYTGDMPTPCQYNDQITDTATDVDDPSAYFFYNGDSFKTKINYYPMVFQGTLYEENTDCSVSTPWWLISIFDAWGTKTGFISEEPIAGNDKLKIIGSDTYYAINDFINESSPSQIWDSGFLGVPYPIQVD